MFMKISILTNRRQKKADSSRTFVSQRLFQTVIYGDLRGIPQEMMLKTTIFQRFVHSSILCSVIKMCSIMIAVQKKDAIAENVLTKLCTRHTLSVPVQLIAEVFSLIM